MKAQYYLSIAAFMLILVPWFSLAQDIMPIRNKNNSYPVAIDPFQQKDMLKAEGDNWFYGSDAPDNQEKPYPQARSTVYFNMLWLVPVLRFLITVKDESIFIDQEPVSVLLPVVLTVTGNWWFGEELVREKMNDNRERVVGDPVLPFSDPSDMDGGHKKNSETEKSTSDSDKCTGNSGYFNEKESRGNERNNSDDENQDDEPTRSSIPSLSKEVGHRKNLQKMLIEKIKEEDNISVFCLLHYSGADPNLSYLGVYPLVAALEVMNVEIIDLLLSFGAVPSEPNQYEALIATLSEQSKQNILTISRVFTVLEENKYKLFLRVEIRSPDGQSMIRKLYMGVFPWLPVSYFKSLLELGSSNARKYYHRLICRMMIIGASISDHEEYFFDFIRVLISSGGNLLGGKKRCLFAIFFSCSVESIYSKSITDELRMLAISSLKDNCIDLNSIQVSGVPLFLHVIVNPFSYSRASLIMLVENGLIPLYCADVGDNLKEWSYLFQFIKRAQNRCFAYKSLQYKCFQVIFSGIKKPEDFCTLTLPSDMFTKTFSAVFADLTNEGSPISTDHKREIIERHYSIRPNEHIDSQTYQDLEAELDAINHPCYEDDLYPLDTVDVYFLDLVWVCSEESIHECYSDERIRLFEEELLQSGR